MIEFRTTVKSWRRRSTKGSGGGHWEAAGVDVALEVDALNGVESSDGGDEENLYSFIKTLDLGFFRFMDN